MSEPYITQLKYNEAKNLNLSEEKLEELTSIEETGPMTADQTMINQVFPVPKSHFDLIQLQNLEDPLAEEN